MKIYGDYFSGNCYKVALICELLCIQHDWVNVDVLQDQTQSREFLQINPNGKIPLLELDDGRYLSESNAIINFLAHGSKLLPKDSFELASVQQWQFFEQYSHEPYIAVARFIARYLGLPDDRRAEYESKHAGGNKALSVMETRLTSAPFLAGSFLTTADISLYAYTHVADEGGFDLGTYPAIREWLARIEEHPRYQSMTSLSAGRS